MSSTKSILVTGATGNQGGGVVRHCLKGGHQVLAYVRDPSSAAAQELQKLGAQLVAGDFEDVEALKAAAQGVDAVFHAPVQTGDTDEDLRLTGNVVDAARASPRAPAMILSTASKTGQHETFPGWGPGHAMYGYWLSKHAVEERVRAAGFERATIVRPAHFMQNLKPPVAPLLFPGFLSHDRTLRVAWRPETRVAWIDPADVGVVAEAALARPEAFAGREIELAAEALTTEQLAEKLGRALRAPVQCHFFSEQELADPNTRGVATPAQQWANDVPGEDAAEAAKEFALTSVDSFLERNIDVIKGGG